MGYQNRASREEQAGIRIARTNRDALGQIAGKVAAWLAATQPEELLNISEDVLTDAEYNRYQRACEEVQRRLFAMGAQ
jgi:hypothetical protein